MARAEGLPSGVAVTTVIAFGSTGSLSTASAIQAWNLANGSASSGLGLAMVDSCEQAHCAVTPQARQATFLGEGAPGEGLCRDAPSQDRRPLAPPRVAVRRDRYQDDWQR